MEEGLRREFDRDVLVYVPNYYICPKCDFRFPEWKDEALPKCPYDGKDVVKMTWVEYAKELEQDLREALRLLRDSSEKKARKR